MGGDIGEWAEIKGRFSVIYLNNLNNDAAGTTMRYYSAV